MNFRAAQPSVARAMSDIVMSHRALMTVDPDGAAAHQGRGIARRLWERVRAEALAAGATGEFTVNSSLAAVAVYRRFGFRETGPCRREAGVAFVPMRLEHAPPVDGEATTA